MTLYQKQLMAYCYSRDTAVHFEYVFDKRDDSMAVRLFLDEFTYWYITFEQDDESRVKVVEYTTTKSCYHPTTRLNYINRYLKRYRVHNRRCCSLTLKELLLVMDKLSVDPTMLNIDQKDKYYPWRSVVRATGRY